MGRRKIEIKAIKDDRNRSVTFLKRKGGLFKKAYELGVLCSVDVAVIIVGPNNRIYEFSSNKMSDILRYYDSLAAQDDNGIYEHRGPKDFTGSKPSDEDGDLDYDDGAMSPGFHSNVSPEPVPASINMSSQSLNSQIPYPAHSHSHHSSSMSPPLDGGFRDQQQQQPPSQQSQNSSRSDPRTHQRQNSGHSYGYPAHSHPPTTTSMPAPPSLPQFSYSGSGIPRMSHMSQTSTASPPSMQQPPPARAPYPPPPPHFSSDLHLPPFQIQPDQPSFRLNASTVKSKNKSMSTARNSIFTPIDDRRSLLAAHWKNNVPSTKMEPMIDHVSNGSVISMPNNGHVNGDSNGHHGGGSKISHSGPSGPSRGYGQSSSSSSSNSHVTLSPPSKGGDTASPRRTTLTLNREQLLNAPLVSPGPPTHMSESSYFNHRNSSITSLTGSGLNTGTEKRPRLKVEIPNEDSDSELDSKSAHPGTRTMSLSMSNGAAGAAGAVNLKEGGNNANDAPSGVFLPPLSPSAGSLPNPVGGYNGGSRTTHHVSYRTGGDETPLSVLGGRFNFDRALDLPETPFRTNFLPSPVGLTTPGGFKALSSDPDYARKRRSSEGDTENVAAKKIKA